MAQSVYDILESSGMRGKNGVFNPNGFLNLRRSRIGIVLSWFLVFHDSQEQRSSHRDVSSADDTSLGVGFLCPNRVG